MIVYLYYLYKTVWNNCFVINYKENDMKKRWILWWVCNIFWFTLLLIGSIFVWIREVDGTGAVQTPELKMLAFIVLLMAFIIPVGIQVVWLIINVFTTRKKNSYST